MTLQEIKDLLRSRPGYIKWGSGKLSIKLEADLELCSQALREVRKELVYPKEKDKDDNLILSKTWQVQKKGGETQWLESFKNAPFEVDILNKEDWIDILKEAGDIKEYKPKKGPILPSNNRTLIIWTSDKHIGSCIPSDALYKKKYNEHIFHRRMEQIYDETINLFKIYGKFDELVIVDLGDSLDGYNGYTTRGGHQLPQNLNNKEAARVHFFTHKWFYDTLIGENLANKVKVVHITNDNHSGDFGWQASFALSQYGSIAWPNVEFVIQEEFLGHITVYDKAFITTHGKDKKNRNKGLPLKVNADTESFLMDYVFDRKLNNYDIHVRKGDIHLNDLDCTRNKMTYWNIGSVFGASDWIMDNFSDTKPSCVFEIVEKEENSLVAKVLWLK